MIGQVMRISTVFANMMAATSFALAITIAAAGTIERTSTHCYGCLHASGAIVKRAPAQVKSPTPIQLAFGSIRDAGSL